MFGYRLLDGLEFVLRRIGGHAEGICGALEVLRQAARRYQQYLVTEAGQCIQDWQDWVQVARPTDRARGKNPHLSQDRSPG